ncbi:hypothetical protein AWH62_13400 [Maricaulis sp. W15]|nr:hypothetical protein AWH62_13400 [Maricaulis sp. W15]
MVDWLYYWRLFRGTGNRKLMKIDDDLKGQDTLKIRWHDARFDDSGVEADYLVFSWPNERFQSGLTLIGFSIAWLAAGTIDLMYLTDTSYLLPVFGSRIATALFGFAMGGWLLVARPQNGDRWPRRVVLIWLMMSTATGVTVSSLYPHTLANAYELEQMLVFNSFWMSVQMLGLGVALSSQLRGVAIASTAYAGSYVANVIYWADVVPYPVVGPTIVLLAGCVFAVVLSIAFSISARRRYYLTWKYNEARAAAERALGFSSFLLSAAGHDIRQPIYALDLNASAIEELAAEGKWDRVMTMIARQRFTLRHISGLIASILELSQLDLHDQKASRDEIDVNALLTGLATSFASLASHHGVSIRVVPTRRHLIADRAVLEHVMNNLVANALTHSGGTRVVLGVRRTTNGWALCVADDGSGFRVDDQTSEPATSGRDITRSGLGSTIMFRLAELGGLELDIRSTAGHGVMARLVCPDN